MTSAVCKLSMEFRQMSTAGNWSGLIGLLHRNTCSFFCEELPALLAGCRLEDDSRRGGIPWQKLETHLHIRWNPARVFARLTPRFPSGKQGTTPWPCTHNDFLSSARVALHGITTLKSQYEISSNLLCQDGFQNKVPLMDGD